MIKILYLGWIGHNNLGDDLLLNIFISLGKKYVNKPYKITSLSPKADFDFNILKSHDVIVLGGGSLISPHLINILHKGIKLGKKIIIWGSGIDHVEEQDINRIKSHNNVDLSKIFNQKEAFILKETFSKAEFAGVRGHYTKEALRTLGVDEKHIKIIGDPGILLPTKTNSYKKNNKIIAINWGTSYNKIYGKNEQKLENQLIFTAKKLINNGYKILLYTVWDTDIKECERLYKRINDPQNVILDTNLYKEKQLIDILSNVTLTINFKLHPNLISLAAGTPCIALGYRYKVFDLLHSIGLEKYVVSTGDPNLITKVLNLITLIEKQNGEILKEFQTNRTRYKPLIEQPFLKNFFTY